MESKANSENSSPESKSNSAKEKRSKRYKDEERESKNSHKREKRSRSRSRDRYRSKRRYRDLDHSEEDYPRYYGDKKENNDTYWTKYPKRDDNVVGSRYYDEADKNKEEEKKHEVMEAPPVKPRKNIDMLTSRTGGAYIPPAKLRMMQAEITDKTSAAYQRIAWEALKKSIHGCINKVNIGNLNIISLELLRENIVRGRGLLCKSIIQAQAASPTFTNVYAALVAVINSKFPNIGELLLKRLILQFKRSYKQNNKAVCISAATFIAHLVNQQVAHEILALEILTLLLETPTDDSVEVGIAFLKECGQKLMEMSSKGINGIFEILRNILHEGKLEKRIQYMIEVMFQIRKDGFKDHAAVIPDLDEVDEKDQITHLITLDDVKQSNSEDVLNVFKFDENYKENEDKYDAIKNEILDDDNSDESGSESGSDEEEGEEGDETEKPEGEIIDNTSTNLLALRRNIYLTIQSSLDFEECAHKLLKMEIKPGQEIEMCHMFLDCCAEQRTYEKFYGLLAQRFCQINKIYVEPFQQIFKDTYATTHRLDTNRLRNVSKFFAHLLFTDGISWEVMEVIQLTEQDTNSSSRIFIKTLFQELAEYMGLKKLNERLKDPTLQEVFSGLFPRDNPRNTRFAINFFTTIGLGGLTDELRQHLAQMSNNNAKNINVNEDSDAKSEASGDESDSSDSSSSSSSSESSSSSSEDEKSKKKKKSDKNKKKVIRVEKKTYSKEVRSEEKSSKRDKPQKDERSRRHEETRKRDDSRKHDESSKSYKSSRHVDNERDYRSKRNSDRRKNERRN